MPPQTPQEPQAPISPPVQPAAPQGPSVFSPQSSAPGAPPAGTPTIHQLRQTRIMLFGVATLAILFLVTTLVFVSKASTTSANLQARYDNGVEDGKAAQDKADKIKYNKELTLDFRTYEAPSTSGSFLINYPKNWSLSIDSTSSDPTLGRVNPEYVDQKSTTGYALSFDLRDSSYDTMKKRFDDTVKSSKGSLRAEAVTVSGIKGYKYTGLLDTHATKKGTAVVLPLRDKTMILQTDNNELYLDVYSRFLTEAKLIP